MANNKKKEKMKQPNIDMEPFDKQLQLLNSDYLVTYFIAGIGSGKSEIGTFACLLKAVMHPGIRVLMAAPTMKMLKNSCLLKLYAMLDKYNIAFTENKNDKKIILYNGSEIHYSSLENFDTIRGSEYTCVLLDELSYLSTKDDQEKGLSALKVVLGRLRQVNPNSTKVYDPKTKKWSYQPYCDYKVWVTTTPKGKLSCRSY